MPNIIINGKTHKAKEGEVLLDVIKRAGIEVPTLCDHPDLKAFGACRMCVVEVEGMNNLITSCSHPVQDGMKIETHSPRVQQARKVNLELLLARHPDDCLYCGRSGNCNLQSLAYEFDIKDRRFKKDVRDRTYDDADYSIIRDTSKCILCGRCVRVCEEVQTVSAIDLIHRGSQTKVSPSFEVALNDTACVECGQCVKACPVGALIEKSHVSRLLDAIKDPKKTVVIQHAPSISVTVGEHFGLPADKDTTDYMNTALKSIGVDRIFDTSFGADMTIMEEAAEFIHRFQHGGTLPLFTSCCPAWEKFVEEFYPEFLPNLSSARSPQAMFAAAIKTYFAEKNNLKADDIFMASIMPCTAKKTEIERPELKNHFTDVPDVDAVITTREFIKILEMYNIDLSKVEPTPSDNPFGTISSAGKIFATSGGVIEAAIRTGAYYLTGESLPQLDLTDLRGLEGTKEAKVEIAGTEFKIAVVNGLGNARKLLEQVKSGEKSYACIEVMACPGGCINGGGQPHDLDYKKVQDRMKLLYSMDGKSKLRESHKNPDIQKLYKEFIGEPLGEKAHKLLHTHYPKKEVKY